jgi:hypothetical protein
MSIPLNYGIGASRYAGGNAEGYEVLSGRQIYGQLSRTLLNRMPGLLHLPRILGQTEDPRVAWPLAEVAERLVVDGTIAAYNGVLLGDLSPHAEATRTYLRQDLPDGKTVRTFEAVSITADGQAAGGWKITDWTDYDDPEKRTAIAEESAPLPALRIYPNGRGVIYWAQWTFERIERACCTIEDQMSGAALALIVTGFLGDWEQAKTELSTGRRVANFPGRNVQVFRVGSTAVIDHLLAEIDMLRPNYLMATYLTDTSKGANTSGEAWPIRLESMKYFVQQTQALLRRIYSEVFGKTLAFANIQVTSAQARQQEFELLLAMRSNGVLEDNEFKAAARNLRPS